MLLLPITTSAGEHAIIFEDHGVNHMHAKVIPLHGTQPGEWKARHSKMKYYMTEYDNYIVSADDPRGK